MNRDSFSGILAIAAGAAVLASAAPASAQSGRFSSTDWRRGDRSDSVSTAGSSQLLALEIRFGGYSPLIDSEPGFEKQKLEADKRPYQQVFGTGPQFYFGLELDVLPIRIPYIGVLGPGFGWGYSSTSAKAKFIEGPKKGTESDETTSLTIMPMYLAAVLRADELMRRTGIPLVPYGKFGFGLATWSASNNAGTETYTGSGAKAVTYDGKGLSWGVHFALGGMLALNFIDPRSAARLDETTGVNHAYLFGEWMNNADIGRHSTKQMYAGSSTWVVGFAIDM